MKKYTYVPGSFIAAWLIWELIVRLSGFNEALLPTPYKVLLGFGEPHRRRRVVQGCCGQFGALFHRLCHFRRSRRVLGLILGWYKGIWSYINPIVQCDSSHFTGGMVAVYRTFLRYRTGAGHRYHLYRGVFPSSVCPRCPRFRILIPYTSRWPEILASSSRNCYLKLYCPPCFPASHRAFTSRRHGVDLPGDGEMVGSQTGLDSSSSICGIICVTIF